LDILHLFDGKLRQGGAKSNRAGGISAKVYGGFMDGRGVECHGMRAIERDDPMRLTLPALLCLTLVACLPVPGPVPDPDPVPVQGACGATALQGLVGQNLAALPASGPWGALRVIRPGMMVTMDYSETRLNAEVDAAETILALRCG